MTSHFNGRVYTADFCSFWGRENGCLPLLDHVLRIDNWLAVLFFCKHIPTPWLLHQTVFGLFAYYLLGYVHSAHLGHGFIGPLDVELAPNVVLQPDLLVILNVGLEKITDIHVIGTPDLVIEVSSPGTIG